MSAPEPAVDPENPDRDAEGAAREGGSVEKPRPGAKDKTDKTDNTPEESEAETRWEKISANLKTIGGAVLLALVIRTCLFEAFEIEGPSMEPTLLNGDRVVVSQFSFGLFLPFRDEAEITWSGPALGDVGVSGGAARGLP